jgi:hypothetical protein
MDVADEWLLLLYFLPARLAGARVQAWRRLQRVGAVGLRNSAYVLPDSAETREDLAWIKTEIAAAGGDALVLLARSPDPGTTREIVDAFQAARRREFDALARDAAALVARTSRPTRLAAERRRRTQAVRRLRERFDEAVRVDFFLSPRRQRVADLLTRLEQPRRERPAMPTTHTTVLNPAEYRNKRWLTRPRPGVDRMSSAWLIRRFVDPNATFLFGDPARVPKAIPFDTFDAEFGHHDGACTFETLCRRFAIDDPAALRIGRIVHDLDLKENPRDAETATVGRMVDGLRRAFDDDDQGLLNQGMAMFEALYRSYETQPARARPRERKTRS